MVIAKFVHCVSSATSVVLAATYGSNKTKVLYATAATPGNRSRRSATSEVKTKDEVKKLQQQSQIVVAAAATENYQDDDNNDNIYTNGGNNNIF